MCFQVVILMYFQVVMYLQVVIFQVDISMYFQVVISSYRFSS